MQARRDAAPLVSEQASIALRLLLGAIADIKGLAPSKARWLQVPEEGPEPFRSGAAFDPLRALAEQGIIGAWTIAKGSASLRLLTPADALRTGRNGLSLAMVQAAKPNIVVLPASGHLRKKLAPELGDWIDDWAKHMATLAPRAAAADKAARLPTSLVADHANGFIAVWSALADRLLRWSA